MKLVFYVLYVADEVTEGCKAESGKVCDKDADDRDQQEREKLKIVRSAADGYSDDN